LIAQALDVKSEGLHSMSKNTGNGWLLIKKMFYIYS